MMFSTYLLLSVLGVALIKGSNAGLLRGLQKDETESDPNYSYKLLQDAPWLNFGKGGRAKVLDVSNITNITMGFAYLELFPGGVRELHWHPFSTEWTYVLEGSCRITLMDNEGRYSNKVAKAGDFWSFPVGYGHVLQGEEEGCKMVLWFDAPFSPTYNDLSISEMLRTKGGSPSTDRVFPVDVVAENLNTPEKIVETFPGNMVFVNHEPYPLGDFPQSKYPLPYDPVFTAEDGTCKDLGKGGYIYEVKKDIFPAITTMSGGFIHLEKDSLRGIHWHPNADELHYVIKGKVQVTIYSVGTQPKGFGTTYTIEEGDVGFAPRNYAHYIEAVDGPADILLGFNNPSWTNQELTSWVAVTPPYLTAASLALDPKTGTEMIEKYFPKETEIFFGKEFDGCSGTNTVQVVDTKA